MSPHSLVSLCDRLKQRYGNDQQDWQSMFQERNVRDIEFIRYIVNFIIEQAKHNIVISELPDVIQTLHCEAEATIRKNRMITLEEAISRVQTAGALKYPYLKKVKPISDEDFVKEVMREVVNRLGTVIKLDMIENICRFTTCSVKQLLHAMPAIDVDEAATLIIEDISRDIDKNPNGNNTAVLKSTINLPSSSAMNRQAYRKPDDTPLSIDKERGKSERESSRSTQKTKSTKHLEYRDLPMTKKKKSKSPKSPSTSQRSSKRDNKTQQSNNRIDLNEERYLKSTTFNMNSHFAQTVMGNSFATIRKYKSLKESSVHEQSKNKNEKIIDPLTSDQCLISNDNRESLAVMTESNTSDNPEKLSPDRQESHVVDSIPHQKVKLTRSKSNTQTYSIHSEEGLSIEMRNQNITVGSDINDNTIAEPTRSLNKIFQKSIKQTSFSNPALYSKDHPFLIEAIHNLDTKERKSHPKVLQSIRHYSKYCYQYSDTSDNEELMTEIDTETCPLEDIVDRRFKHQI